PTYKERALRATSIGWHGSAFVVTPPNSGRARCALLLCMGVVNPPMSTYALEPFPEVVNSARDPFVRSDDGSEPPSIRVGSAEHQFQHTGHDHDKTQLHLRNRRQQARWPW